jgi:addiction module HigA family antidote
MDLKMLRPPTSVGEILEEEFLKPLGITQTALAKHLHWTQPKINEIIQGKRGITPETAMALGDAFGMSAEFWLNAQRATDLWKAQQTHKKISLLPQLRPDTARATKGAVRNSRRRKLG